MRALARLLMVAAVLAAACGDKGTDPQSSIAGRYVLQTVDGAPLPAVMDETIPLSLTAASITLTDGGQFSLSETVRLGEGSEAVDMTVTGNGTYTRSGGTITMTLALEEEEPGDNVLVATLGDRTLTVISDGKTCVFRR